MLKLGIGLDKSVKKITTSSGTDPDAQAFFNRVTAAGGTLTATEQTAVNLLVLNMKTANVWNLQQAIYPMVGSSAAACAQNLKSASFTGTFSSGWTFTTSGASTTKGSGSYMDTGLLASSALNLNNAHISYYNNLAVLGDQNIIMGDGTLSLGAWMGLYQASNLFYGSIAFSYGSIVMGSNQAFFMLNKTSSGFADYIKNTTRTNNSVTTTSLSSAQNIYLNNYDTAATFSAGARCAFSSIGSGMTSTQAFDLYSAVQAFNTSLSRQV